MVCVECRALLEEYAARNDTYRRAVEEYRTHLSQGLMDSLELARHRVQETRASVRQARIMHEQHKTGCH